MKTAKQTVFEDEMAARGEWAVLIAKGALTGIPVDPKRVNDPYYNPKFLDPSELTVRLGLPVVAVSADVRGHGQGSRPGVEIADYERVREALADTRSLFAEVPAGVRTDEDFVVWVRAQTQTIRTLIDDLGSAIETFATTEDVDGDDDTPSVAQSAFWDVLRRLDTVSETAALVRDQAHEFNNVEPSTDDDHASIAEPITTVEFDQKFDDGEDISQHLDFSKARRPGRKTQK